MAIKPHFTTPDYILFVAVLSISVTTGIFFACKDRKKKSTNMYFFGDGKMSPIPVGLSIGVSFISSILLMGTPVEVYLYGTMWLWNIPPIPVAVLITCIYFIPFYHKLQLKCVYQYIEYRFCRAARLMCSALVGFYMLFYMAVVVYYPALAMTTLTPISVPWSITITSILCTFYSVIGGFKSVVWTDTFQSLIMLVGSVAILIRTTILVGGVDAVFAAIERGNRTNLWNFDADPMKRCSSLSIFFGILTFYMTIMATNQTEIQRYLSCKNLKASRQSLIVSIVPYGLISFIAGATGAAMYAFFEDCDPIESGEINIKDQMVPLLVAKITKGFPGLNGLFVAAIYCGTMSTVSSGINSVTLLIIEDFVSINFKLKESTKLLISNLCGIILGTIVLGLSFAVMYMKGTVMQISLTLLSSFIPPVFGMFTLGIFVPISNTKATLIGTVSGFVLVLWISISAVFSEIDETMLLPVEADKCNSTIYLSSTILENSTTLPNEFTKLSTKKKGSNKKISFLHYRLISYLVTLVVGTIASLIIGPRNSKNANPRYFMPLIDNPLFPDKVIKFMRFGVKDEKISNVSEEKKTFFD